MAPQKSKFEVPNWNMLDSDLAMLYQVETKRINEGVKRNQKRFPETFCFQLSEDKGSNDAASNSI